MYCSLRGGVGDGKLRFSELERIGQKKQNVIYRNGVPFPKISVRTVRSSENVECR